MLPGGRNTVVSPVVFDDIDFCFRVYEPWAGYGQPKTANILFAVEATRRWAADGITVNALNPGAIATNLQRHAPSLPATVEPIWC
jgi:NAD(P)-dependent dehydrogenase (short-subunit alcohol dehydrogenase family)